MNIIFIVLGVSALFYIAYRTYGTFLSKKIFDLNDNNKTPSVEMEDGLDYVPTEPKFLLLDEPFTGVDPIAVQDIQNIILRLKAKGIGVLISDHNVRETLGICDRAYIVSEGHILEEGCPETIVASAKARSIYLGENFTM